MKSKLSIAILSIFFIFLTFTPVYAFDSWQLISGNDEWEIAGRILWKTKNNPNDAYLNYKYNNSLAFTKWNAKVQQVICEYVKPAKFSHFINFSLSNSTTSINWSVEWFLDSEHPIIQSRVKTYIRITDPNNYSKLKWIDINPFGSHFPIQFSAVRITENVLNLKIAVYPNNEYKDAISTYEVNYTLSTSFFDSSKVFQNIRKHIVQQRYSNIQVAGILKDEIFICDGTVGEQEEFTSMPFWQYIGWTIWNGITGEITYIGSKLRELMPYLGWLYDSLAFCFTFAAGFVYNIVTFALPFFPFIIIFWLMDATVTSVQDGNLQPIGNAFMTIFDFLRGVIQTIVNILDTIYNYVRGLFP